MTKMLDLLWKKKKLPLDEIEVRLIRMLAAEFTPTQMAFEMDITERQLRKCFKSIREKTGAVTEVGIIMFALRHGMITA